MNASKWIACAAWLDGALEAAGRTHTLAHVERMIAEGDAQLWTGKRSAMVTVVEEEPCERRLVVWLAGGALDELVDDLRPAAERWGKRLNCRRILVIGRAGWERALAPAGYAPLARIIAKDL